MSSCRAAWAAHPRTLPPCAVDTELEREQYVNIKQVKVRVDADGRRRCLETWISGSGRQRDYEVALGHEMTLEQGDTL
jgi:hypothetical protein